MISWTDSPVPSPRPPRPGRPRPRHGRPALPRRAARAACRGAARALGALLWPEHALYNKLERTAAWK